MKKKFLFLIYVCFPFFLIFPLINLIFKSLKTRSAPTDRYYTWVIALFLIPTLFTYYPVLSDIDYLLVQPTLVNIFLGLDILFSVIPICIIFHIAKYDREIRKLVFTESNEFSISCCIIFLLYILVPFFINDFHDVENVSHPYLRMFIQSLKETNILGVMLSFISICIIAPVLEEVVFRGLLIKDFQPTKCEVERSEHKNFFLHDFIFSLIFAALHLPAYFLDPFIFSCLAYYIRRRTQNLKIVIIWHIITNTIVIAAITRTYFK